MLSVCWPVFSAALSMASPPCRNVSKLEFAISNPPGRLFRGETRSDRKGCMASATAFFMRSCLHSAPVGVMVAARRAGAAGPLMIRLFSALLAALALFVCAEAQAHPHVWVTMKSEVVYGADGAA